jgi:hypothetical protein
VEQKMIYRDRWCKEAAAECASWNVRG